MEHTNNQTIYQNLSKASQYLFGVAQVQANSLQQEIFSLLSSKYSLNQIKKALKKGTVVLDKMNSVFCEMGIQNLFLILRRLVHVINGIGMHTLQKLQKSLVKNSHQLRQSHAFEFHAQIKNVPESDFVQKEIKFNERKPKLNKMRGISLFNENYKRKIDQNKQKQTNANQKEKDDDMDESSYKQKLFEEMKQQIQAVENQLHTPITDQISSFILLEKKFLETFNHFQCSEDLQKMTNFLESSNVLTQQFLSKFDLKTGEVALFKTEIDTFVVELKMDNKVRSKNLSLKFKQIMDKFIKNRLQMHEEASIKLQQNNKLQKQKQMKKVSVGVETVLKDFAAIKSYERKIISVEQKLKFKEEQRQKYLIDNDKQKRTFQIQIAQLKVANTQLTEQLAHLRQLKQELCLKLEQNQQTKESQKCGKQQIIVVMKNGVQFSSQKRQEKNQNKTKEDSNGNFPKSKNNIEIKRLSNASSNSNLEISNKNNIRETIGQQSEFKSSLNEEKSEFNQIKNTIMPLEEKKTSGEADKQRKVRMKDIFDLEIQEQASELESKCWQVQNKINKTQKLIRLKSSLSSKSLKFEQQKHIKQTGVHKTELNIAFEFQKPKQSLDYCSFQNKGKQNQLTKQLLKSGTSESYEFEKIHIPFSKSKIENLQKHLQLNQQNNVQIQMKKSEDIKKVGYLNALKQVGRNNIKNKENAKTVEPKKQTKSQIIESFKNKGDQKIRKNDLPSKKGKGNQFDYCNAFSLMFCNGTMEFQQIHQKFKSHRIPSLKGNKLLKVKSDEREKQLNDIQFAAQGCFSPSWASNEEIKDNDGKFHLPSLDNKKNHTRASAYKKAQKQFESLNNVSKQQILNAKDLKVQDYIQILKSQGSSKLEILQVFQNFGSCYQNKKIPQPNKLNVEDFIKIIAYKEFDCFDIKKKQIKKQRSLSVDNVEIEHHLIDSAFKVRSIATNNDEVQKSNKITVPNNKSLIEKIFKERMKSRKEETLPDLSIGYQNVHDQQNQIHGKIKNKLKKTHRKKQEIQILVKSVKSKQIIEELQERELPEIKIKSIFRN